VQIGGPDLAQPPAWSAAWQNKNSPLLDPILPEPKLHEIPFSSLGKKTCQRATPVLRAFRSVAAQHLMQQGKLAVIP
jgi:hypothetical protein